MRGHLGRRKVAQTARARPPPCNEWETSDGGELRLKALRASIDSSSGEIRGEMLLRAVVRTAAGSELLPVLPGSWVQDVLYAKPRRVTVEEAGVRSHVLEGAYAAAGIMSAW